MTRVRSFRFAAALGACLTALAVAAPVASADPAKPGNAVSEVTGLQPTTPLVRLAVVGGDGFLEASVATGHELVVLGYEGEPYLRIDTDGTVERNDRSPATFLNKNRYGAGARPIGVDAKAAPQWSKIGSGGSTIWHDHRIHLMSTLTNAPIPADVANWKVQMQLDGTSLVASGTYVRVAAPSSTLWWIVAAVLALAIVVRLRKSVLRTAAVALAVVLAVAVAWSQAVELPVDAGGGIRRLLAPGAAVVLLALSFVLKNLRRSMLAGAAGAVVVWAVTQRAVLSNAVLLSGFPEWFERLSVSIGFGVGLGVGVAIAGELAGWDADRVMKVLRPPRPATPARGSTGTD